jgi:phenylpyruvate tautomerase PptA (4-oxalocrotonate tautomerase family)
MPHFIVNCYKGRSPEFKKDTAEKIKKLAVECFGCGPERVSVAFKEHDKENWKSVYEGEIMANEDCLVIKPGYTMD